jgi:NAD(P)-dependent dehydrogenase (short-subunit alcohol dehydrogenase family)
VNDGERWARAAASRAAVLVTGASSGIGLACATRLAALGCTVFAGVRARETQARLAATAGVTPVMLDVTREEDIAAARESIARSLPAGGLVGLVNSAGVMVSGPLEHVASAALRRQLDVNVIGAVDVTRAFLPLLREAEGRIVNIGSTSGRVPSAFAGPYCAAKFAMEAITTVWREELRSSGVSVHSVDPGVVRTPLWEKAATAEQALGCQLSTDGRRHYGEALARRGDLLRRLATAGASEDGVCAAVAHALFASRPKRRYTVGLDAKLRIAAARAMPERLRYWVAGRVR